MKTPRIHPGSEKFDSRYNNPNRPLTPKLIPSSEVFTTDDYQGAGFKGFDNHTRSKPEIRAWAEETKDLAKKSLFFHSLELPIKIISHFFKREDSESGLARGGFVLSKAAETLGGMFRNQIYGREDDNLGAESFAAEHYGDNASKRLGTINNFIQTKLKFAVPILGLFNRELANDLDWVVTDTVDSAWWRNMSVNSGFFPGMGQAFGTKAKNAVLELFNKGTGETESGEALLKYIGKQVKESYNTAKNAWDTYRNGTGNEEEKKKALLHFASEMDKSTAIILPFICIPANFIGDVFRPIARRLGIQGPIRTLTRTLSVADRGLLGINYVFRFLIPSRVAENEAGESGPWRASNFYMASLAGDILDVPLTIFKDKIRESSPYAHDAVSLMRIVKDTTFSMFWSQKRVSASNRVLNNLDDNNN